VWDGGSRSACQHPASSPKENTMPPPFQRLTIRQFADVLQAFRFTRKVTAVHMHHTWRPDHRMWRGEASMLGMWRSHTQERGFSDIAQHLTIDPEGGLWTGRGWNQAPASAVGHNGNALAGPFMFETVGNFDVGGDPFAGAQRQAVLDVIALVNRRFGLDAETLLFHNQVSAKTCPGSSIGRTAFVAELRAHVPSTDQAPRGRAAARAAGVAASGTVADAAAHQALVQSTVAWLAATPVGARAADPLATPLEELDYSFSGPAGNGVDGARGLFGGDDRLTPADIDALRPHVVNLRQGRFSSDGLMTGSDTDVDMILFEHAAAAARQAVAAGRPFRLMLWAHGGLVKESAGLETARAHVAWWRDNGVYPVHFIWETGFFETVRDLLHRSREGAGASRNLFSDWVSDRLLERGTRALQAPRIWQGMKASARAASAPGGGAALFIERLAAFCAWFAEQHGPSGGRLELHAGGHSAGSIFMAHLLQAAAAQAGLPAIQGLHLLAPAVRVDLFRQLLEPLVGQTVQSLAVFTMRRDLERADHCAHVYRKSLLYLVAAACESEADTPILGLEESLRADAGLRTLFGLGGAAPGAAELVWSTSPLAEGRAASRATAHGDFDNDPPTMEAVARRVLGLQDTEPLPCRYPVSASRAVRDPWADGVDWPPEFAGPGPAPQSQAGGAAAWPFSPAAPVPAAGAGPSGGSDLPTGGCAAGAAEPHVAALDLPVGALPAQPGAAAVPAGAGGGAGRHGGRRRALCVGIDTYATAPLAGCVRDAELWHEVLQSLGFEVTLLRNEQAREAPLMAALRGLLLEAAPGDELVFQFAGHGTQAPDLDGDEADGDTPGFDEALCPHDHDQGPLLVDDSLAALINQVPAGVRVTCFMDCCHSGTNTRVLPAAGARARGLRLTAAQRQAYVDWRRSQPASRAPLAPREDHELVEVAFAACQSKELAWESNGHGEFTLRATRLLQQGGAAWTPDQFHTRLLAAFGPDRQQTPALTAAPARLGERLFLG